MSNLYKKTAADVLDGLPDILGSDSIVAVSFGFSKGTWYLDWEMRVPKRNGFLGADEDRCVMEPLFEAIAIDSVTTLERDTIRDRLRDLAPFKWIDPSEMAWRKQYVVTRASKCVLVESTRTRIAGPGSSIEGRGGYDMDMTGRIVLYSAAKGGFLKGFTARRTREDAEIACVTTRDPYDEGILAFGDAESLNLTLGAFADLTGSQQLVDGWMDVTPAARTDRGDAGIRDTAVRRLTERAPRGRPRGGFYLTSRGFYSL